MKVLIRKFKTIQDLTIEIPASITGGNGTGKSTILEAICFCLTGKDLSGNEFKQVYDNRVDLHDAIADVSYFDSYGNEYRRIVSPIFQTSRAGVEEIKIKRNTVCKKNDIAGNDFAPEFEDFYKFGTDYFFRQKEEIQRAIFIGALKSRLPVYDIAANSLKLKELQKSQKTAISEIEAIRNLQKNTKDVEVPQIDAKLFALNSEYVKLAAVDNSAQIEEVNRRNNAAMSRYLTDKMNAGSDLNTFNLRVKEIDNQIFMIEKRMESENSKVFVCAPEKSAEIQKNQLISLLSDFEKLTFYDTIENYAAVNFAKNPVLVENQKSIIEIQNSIFNPAETSGACPLSGEYCETVKLHAESAFNVAKTKRIQEIKSANRSILENEMWQANRRYNITKAKIDELQTEISEISSYNLRFSESNKESEADFDANKFEVISGLNSKIKDLEVQKNETLSKIQSIETLISELQEPIMEQLPESIQISDELIEAHKQYTAEKESIIGALAVNENNAKNCEKWEADIKTNQVLLFDLDVEVLRIKNEISDYFSNLKDLVKSEFPGEIEISVELLEFVMSRDEYKDCFKITANGKVFPYECNGALQNNLKLQILAGLQRLAGYKGITIMDNCEANTTQSVNACGLNCVLARATDDKVLNV
jgi:hypothetical protein